MGNMRSTSGRGGESVRSSRFTVRRSPTATDCERSAFGGWRFRREERMGFIGLMGLVGLMGRPCFSAHGAVAKPRTDKSKRLTVNRELRTVNCERLTQRAAGGLDRG
jgi:hypothetical protein